MHAAKRAARQPAAVAVDTATPAQPQPGQVRIERIDQVIARTGLSERTIYRQMQARTFPAPVRIGRSAIGWRSTDVDRWIAELPQVDV